MLATFVVALVFRPLAAFASLFPVSLCFPALSGLVPLGSCVDAGMSAVLLPSLGIVVFSVFLSQRCIKGQAFQEFASHDSCDSFKSAVRSVSLKFAQDGSAQILESDVSTVVSTNGAVCENVRTADAGNTGIVEIKVSLAVPAKPISSSGSQNSGKDVGRFPASKM